MSNIWHHAPGIAPEVAAIFDPFGNAVHTALAFPVLGEDVLVTGRGANRDHGGGGGEACGGSACGDLGPECVSARAGAEGWGDALRSILSCTPLAAMLWRILHMTEGFDVGLEMSGNPNAHFET